MIIQINNKIQSCLNNSELNSFKYICEHLSLSYNYINNINLISHSVINTNNSLLKTNQYSDSRELYLTLFYLSKLYGYVKKNKIYDIDTDSKENICQLLDIHFDKNCDINLAEKLNKIDDDTYNKIIIFWLFPILVNDFINYFAAEVGLELNNVKTIKKITKLFVPNNNKILELNEKTIFLSSFLRNSDEIFKKNKINVEIDFFDKYRNDIEYSKLDKINKMSFFKEKINETLTDIVIKQNISQTEDLLCYNVYGGLNMYIQFKKVNKRNVNIVTSVLPKINFQDVLYDYVRLNSNKYFNDEFVEEYYLFFELFIVLVRLLFKKLTTKYIIFNYIST